MIVSAHIEEHLLLFLLMPISFRQVNDVTDSTSEVNQGIGRMSLEHCFIAATKSVWDRGQSVHSVKKHSSTT